MKYTFDRVVRLVIALAVIIGLALLVNRLSGVLLPFLIGWLLAYLIHPLVKFVQYKMKVGIYDYFDFVDKSLCLGNASRFGDKYRNSRLGLICIKQAFVTPQEQRGLLC